ncbi:hypothetical protein M0R45_002276 [Rubus argutus]|uniref:Uncharacterized protein n=1 Tax=Rubus argutus TaxID=59490 RepID=A0AAW1VIR1_RUBAR
MATAWASRSTTVNCVEAVLGASASRLGWIFGRRRGDGYGLCGVDSSGDIVMEVKRWQVWLGIEHGLIERWVLFWRNGCEFVFLQGRHEFMVMEVDGRDGLGVSLAEANVGLVINGYGFGQLRG